MARQDILEFALRASVLAASTVFALPVALVVVFFASL